MYFQNRVLVCNSWSFFCVRGWLCVDLLEGSSSLSKCLNFYGLSEQERIGLHSPMSVPRLVTHRPMKHLHRPTCLAEISTSLLSAKRNSYTDPLKAGVTVNLSSVDLIVNVT